MFLRYISSIVLICALSACSTQKPDQANSDDSSGLDNERELPVTSVTDPQKSEPLNELPESSEEELDVPDDQVREIPRGDIPKEKN